MMNLNFELLDQSVSLNKGTILVLEDPNIFSKVAQSIFEYEEDGEIKFYNNKFIKIKESQLMVITDITKCKIYCGRTRKKERRPLFLMLGFDSQ